MSDAFDYDDIRGSVEKHLAKDKLGWIQIVTECFEEIKEHCDSEEKTYPPVSQIKQKYGALRIYLGCAIEDPFIQSSFEEAAQKADRSCERCGNVSRPQCIGVWYANLCCWHAHEAAVERLKKFPKVGLNLRSKSTALQCLSCGYHGQIAWGVSGHRCPACVSKGW